MDVHSAPQAPRSGLGLANAAATAAERGLGALYGLLYLVDASGYLSGVRAASSGGRRALAKMQQVLGTDLTTLKFDPQERPVLVSAMQDGRAVSVPDLGQVLPLPVEAEKLRAAQRQLGIAQVWLAPLYWNGESLGLLLLLMPPNAPVPLAHSELLGRHVAVALGNLREQEAGRKRGELDAVRWVYDERRFLEELGQEARRAGRHHRPLSILLVRVQNAKALRKRYGRFLAERVLHQVAGRLADAMRDTDFLGAYGEDGFAAILVEAGQEGARRAEERLLSGLDKMQLPHVELPGLDVQLVYAAATLPQGGESAEELTAVAEARLGQENVAQFDMASAS